MTKPIAVQMWTVRKEAEQSLPQTLARLQQIGFPAVETAGLYGLSSAAMRQQLTDAGLELCSAHRGLPDKSEAQAAFSELAELGAPALFPSLGPDSFADDAAIGAAAERFNAIAPVAAAHNIELGYHNHWWEFSKLPDGSLAYKRFLDRLDPTITVEVDTYWAQVGNVQAPGLVEQLGDRVKFLHIKDGALTTEDLDQTAVGDGKMPVEAILRANAAVRWNIVELDGFPGDIWQALERSYAYLAARLLQPTARDSKGEGHGVVPDPRWMRGGFT